MRLQKKSLSRVTLESLLRKKKTNLQGFLRETGIVTYELLAERCASIGVVPPSVSQFLEAKGNPVTHEVSSPMEGIVVLNPIEEIDRNVVEDHDAEVLGNIPVPKKSKKKKSSDDPA